MSDQFKAGLERDGATHGEERSQLHKALQLIVDGIAVAAIIITAMELTGLDERIDTDYLKDRAQQMGEIILSPLAPNLESLDVLVIGDN